MTEDVIDAVLASYLERGVPSPAQGAALASLDRTMKLLLKAMHPDLAPEGLSWAGWVVLMLLAYSRRGALPATRLAKRTGSDASTTTRTIDKLVRSGYVRRLKDERDGRITIVELTDAGRAAQATVTERQAASAFGFAALTERETEQLLKLLKKVRHSLNDTTW